MTARAPRWAVRGPRQWTMFVWLPLCYTLLITPVADPKPGPHSAWSWLMAIAAGAAFTAALLTRYRRGRSWDNACRLLLAILAVLATVTTVAYSSAWSSLFLLLAIGIGVFVTPTTPYLVLLATGLATGSELIGGASLDAAASAGLSVVLTGFGTYAVNQLFAVVAELQCTRQELARMAVSQERERFARDLHDLLGHTLSLIVVKAEAVRRLADLDPVASAGHAADIETVGREALTDIRHAVNGYRGAGLDRELANARSALEAAGINLTLERPSELNGSFTEDADALLGWVVREGVTNVVRHSEAVHCSITLRRTAAGISLTICDDGRGRADSRGVGVGLLGLQERAEAVGGALDLSPYGPGFRVAVDIPAAAAAQVMAG